MSDIPLPPPFGASHGPTVTEGQLLARWMDGERNGVCAVAHLEGCLLVVGDHPLAIRIDGAVLVRDEVPGDVGGMRSTLERFLEGAGMALVEPDSPLGALVGIEVAGLRGDAWSLWARDADEGQAALARRAVGDMPGLLDSDAAQRRAEVDAALAEIERLM